MKRPDPSGDLASRDGQQFVYCKGSKNEYSYANWAQQCTAHHTRKDGKTDPDDDDGNSDGAQRRKQPKAHLPATKTICKKGEPVAKAKSQ